MNPQTGAVRKKVAVILALTVLIQSLSFLSIKLSTLSSGAVSIVFLGMAILFMGFRAMIWQKLLKVAALSLLYPFTSLVQVLILFYAVVFFNETLTIGHLVGLLFMILGSYIVGSE